MTGESPMPADWFGPKLTRKYKSLKIIKSKCNNMTSFLIMCYENNVKSKHVVGALVISRTS